MTNPTPHGQVPEALIDLIDAYAETRHRCGGIYNAKTEAARKAVIEALSGVQALSAGPMVTSEQRRLIGVIAEKIEDGTLFQSGIYQKKDLARFVRNMLDVTPTAPAASPTPPAEQPDLTKLTERGAKAWAGVDAQALRDGTYQQGATKAAPAGFVPVAAFDRLHAHAESLAARLLAASPTLQALSAAPAGWKLVPVEPTRSMMASAVIFANGNAVYKNVSATALEIEESIYGEAYSAMLAASPTPPAPAEQQAAPKAAPGEQNTVPAEWLEQAYREGWAACRDAETIGEEAEDWAFGNSTANSRMIDAQQEAPKAAPGDSAASLVVPDGCPHILWFDDQDLKPVVFAGNGAKRAALEAYRQASMQWNAHLFVRIAVNSRDCLYPCAAPQQEAQEPVAYVHVPHYTVEGKVHPVVSFEKYQQDYADGIYSTRIPLYTAPQPAPQQEAQEPCPTCAALARKPDCYGIRQITDDEGVEEWDDIRTSPDVAREEANDMMATGRGEIYEVVPLWTTPQPAPAPLSDDVVKDAARLDWLALAGPTSICVVSDRPHDGEVEVATDDVTGYGKTLREALDAAIAAQGGA